MEPEVHIIEKYFQEILHCFTMTNIQCKGRKEIDLLAINSIENQRFHVEARVSTALPMRLKETKTKKGNSHKNGVDYFAKEKFNHPYVTERIKEFFGEEKYETILVVYEIYTGGLDKHVVLQPAYKHYGIQIYFISDLIEKLKSSGAKGSRDDVLRLLELVSLPEKESEKAISREQKKIQRDVAKHKKEMRKKRKHEKKS